MTSPASNDPRRAALAGYLRDSPGENSLEDRVEAVLHIIDEADHREGVMRVSTEDPALVEQLIDVLDQHQWDSIEHVRGAVGEITGSVVKARSLNDLGPNIRRIRRRQFIELAEKIRTFLAGG